MTWPDAFLEAAQTIAYSFLAWRSGAFFARWYAEGHGWDERSR